jgi:hypothetical protein
VRMKPAMPTARDRVASPGPTALVAPVRPLRLLRPVGVGVRGFLPASLVDIRRVPNIGVHVAGVAASPGYPFERARGNLRSGLIWP